MVWPATRVAELLRIRYPLVAAPMAGAPSTPALAAAVSGAGALGSLAGAVSSPEGLRDEIRELRRRTDAPFAVNLFAPLPREEPAAEAVARVREVLAPWHEELGLQAPGPVVPPDAFEDKLAVVLEEQVPVLSFTFGIPPLLDEARRAGVTLLGTATTPREALLLARAGVDAVVLQGAEAGGHRGTFAGPFDEALVPLDELIGGAAEAVDVPLVAAGGLVDGAGIAAALRLGAEGVQLGTAFLVAPEAGHRRLTGESCWRAARASSRTRTRAAMHGCCARGSSTRSARRARSLRTRSRPRCSPSCAAPEPSWTAPTCSSCSRAAAPGACASSPPRSSSRRSRARRPTRYGRSTSRTSQLEALTE